MVLSDLNEACFTATDSSARPLWNVIGVGGDGTAAELVNRTLPGLPLTVLPSGNENLLARHFGLGSSPEECAKTIVKGCYVRCDAGLANGRVFLVMCSCGLMRTWSALCMSTVPATSAARATSTRSCPRSAATIIRNFGYTGMTAAADTPSRAASVDPAISPGTDSEGVRWLFAFNMPCYGGGLADCAGSRCRGRAAGRVHVPARRPLARAVLYGGGTDGHAPVADRFAQRRSGGFRVTSDANVPYQLDGDPGGFLPVEISVLPQRLTLLVPRESAGKTGLSAAIETN